MTNRRLELSSRSPASAGRTPVARHGVRSLRPAVVVLALTCMLVLDGCRVVKDIFEAGFGIGVLVVVAVVAIIGGVVAMARKK